VSQPLVTVICLCHNHGRFVAEALLSVKNQTYQPIQLIVVDDASRDNSRQAIADFVRENTNTQFIFHDVNIGVCRAFNSAFEHARGEFIIDLAADDVLLPGRIENGVREFAGRDQSFGAQFGDAYVIDEEGTKIGMHSDRFPSESVPQGDIYTDVIRKFFICGTSMMMRRKVLEELGGFDPSLAYEDFDLWVRSSRLFKYFYTGAPLVKRRIVKGGLHEKQFKAGSTHALTTLTVCRKILSLNRTRQEQAALRSRLNYEIRQSLLRLDFSLAWKYAVLWKQNLSWSPPL
jgi:glycosyltransferase involved in cell wall biosynthesis